MQLDVSHTFFRSTVVNGDEELKVVPGSSLKVVGVCVGESVGHSLARTTLFVSYVPIGSRERKTAVLGSLAPEAVSEP